MSAGSHDPSPRARPWTARSAGLAGLAIALASTAPAACGGDGGSKVSDYCRTVERHLVELESPSIVTAEDIDAQLEMYRSISSGAPIAVQPEWQTVVRDLETASTVDPRDAASLQRAADTARLSQSAAVRIQQYTQQSCGIDIGTPPPATNPVTATTLPTADTDAG